MTGSPRKKGDKKEKYSYADYLKFGDERRYEIIDGVLYDMGPAPTPTHQEIFGALFYKIFDFFQEKPCKVYAAPFDVRLYRKSKKDRDITRVVQPDISVICDETKIDERGCLGAPDFIIEIISPSSASRDHILKRRLYEENGVREYWLVDPINRITTVYCLGKKTSYGAAEIYDDKAKVAVSLFKDLIIDFSTVFPPLPPPGDS
jgi:Uma2 family endonuclease